MTSSFQQPFQTVADLDGTPLTGGYVYFGVANTDPTVLANRIAIFYDAACTIAAPNPVRTSGGFLLNVASPANIYVAGTADFSVAVHNSNNTPRYSIASYPVRLLSSFITFDSLIVGTSVEPDTAGGATNGTEDKPWSSTVSRAMQARSLNVYSQDQPTVNADLGKVTQLMMPLLAVNQTSLAASPSATWFNGYNTDTASCTHTTTGAYTVVPEVPLPSTNVIVKVASIDDASSGFRSVMARVVSTTEIAVRVFIPDTATATDGRFSLSIEGNPAVADPIS